MVVRYLNTCVAWVSERLVEAMHVPSPSATQRSRSARLCLESLGDRVVPATLIWQGNTSDEISVGANWQDKTTGGPYPGGKLTSAGNHILMFTGVTNKAARLDIDLTIASLQIFSTHTGTITLENHLTVKMSVAETLGKMEAGTITGAGKLTLDASANVPPPPGPPTGDFLWTGGTISGTGDLEVKVKTDLRLASSKFLVLENRKLKNSGTISWHSGSIELNGTASIENSGAFFAKSGKFGNDQFSANTMTRRLVDTNVEFNNLTGGTIEALAAPGQWISFVVPVKNSGKTLQLSGGGTVELADGGQNSSTIEFKDPTPTTLALSYGVFGEQYISSKFTWMKGAKIQVASKSSGIVHLTGNSSKYVGVTLQLDEPMDLSSDIRLNTTWAWVDGKDLTVRAKANTIIGLTWTNKVIVAKGAGVNLGSLTTNGNEIAGSGQLLNLGTISLGHSLLLRPNTLFENQIITEQDKTTRGKLILNDGVRIRTSDVNPVLGGMFRNFGDIDVKKMAYLDYVRRDLTGTSNVTIEKPGGDFQIRLYDANNKPTIIFDRIRAGAKTSLLFQGAFDTDTTTLTALPGSTVSGEGTITAAAFLNTGTVDPYADYNAARIDFVADYSQPAGGFLRLDLFGGYGPDTIGVVGTVSLGGSLLLTVPSEGGYFPPSITILDNDASDSIQGTFNGLTEGATVAGGGNGWYYTISYQGGTGNDIVLTRHGNGDADPPPPPPPPPSSGSTISGRLWADNDGDGIQDFGETGIAGILVALLDADGLVIATTLTAADGSYSFTGLAAGTYQLYFNRPTESGSFSPTDAGSDDALDSDIWSDGFSSPLTLGTNATLDIDAGWFGVTGGGET